MFEVEIESEDRLDEKAPRFAILPPGYSPRPQRNLKAAVFSAKTMPSIRLRTADLLLLVLARCLVHLYRSSLALSQIALRFETVDRA